MTGLDFAIVLVFQLIGLLAVYHTVVKRQHAQTLELVRAISALNAAVQNLGNKGQVLPFKR